MNYIENVIEWLRDQKCASLTLTQRSMITRIKRYAGSHPEECKIIAENNDGSICAHVPVTWIKVSPPRQVNMTEDQREEFAERMRVARET